jgi:hypothetical protein
VFALPSLAQRGRVEPQGDRDGKDRKNASNGMGWNPLFSLFFHEKLPLVGSCMISFQVTLF